MLGLPPISKNCLALLKLFKLFKIILAFKNVATVYTFCRQKIDKKWRAHCRFFGLKYLVHLENLGEKKTHRASRFFVFYVKQKIDLTWPYY